METSSTESCLCHNKGSKTQTPKAESKFTTEDFKRMAQLLYSAGKGRVGSDMTTINDVILNTSGNYDLSAEDYKSLLTMYKNAYSNSLLKDLVWEGTHGQSALKLGITP